MAFEVRCRRRREKEEPLSWRGGRFRTWGGWVIPFCVVACEKPVDGGPTAPPVSTAATAAIDKAPTTSISEPAALKVGRQFEIRMGQELLGDFPKRLTRSELSSQTVALRERTGQDIWLSVDDHAPRKAQGRKLAVSDLLNEDVELSPGGHLLMAFSLTGTDDGASPGQMEVQTHNFFVEVEPGRLSAEVGCVAFTPELTKNGPLAAKKLSFWAIPAGAGIDHVRYEVVGQGIHHRGEAPPATEMILEGAPSGDFRLSVHCFSEGRERGYDIQMVTINGDAPDPEEQK